MRINRSLLNWGVFLIALGGIPLAVDQGWLESDIAQDLGRLWPLILVGIGLGLILRWTPISWFGGALVAATFGVIFGAFVVSVRDDDLINLQGIIPAIASGSCVGGGPGDDVTSAGSLARDDAFELDVTFSCGELTISRAAGSTWSLEARHDADDAPQVEETDQDGLTAEVRLGQERADDLAFLGRLAQSEWDVSVPSSAALRVLTTLNAATGVIDAGAGPLLRVAGTFNASDVTIDLADATTPTPASVDLTLNASDGRLALPAGDINARLNLNASSLVVCVPASAGLRVDHSAVLGSDDLGSSGLEDLGSGQWQSPGFDEALAQVTVSVTNTVSSLSLERPEMCS